MDTKCPVCKELDTVQKVSSVVSSGKATANISGPFGALSYNDGVGIIGGYTFSKGNIISQIAKELSLPEHPSEERKINVMQWKTLMIIFGVPGAFVGGTLVLWSFGFLFLEGKPLISLFFLAFGGILLSAFLKGIRKLERVESGTDSDYEARKQIWKAVEKIWNQLYYCSRDDVIFDPENGQFCKPDGIEQFLHSLSSKSGALPQVLNLNILRELEFLKLVKVCFQFAAALVGILVLGMSLTMGNGVLGSLLLTAAVISGLLAIPWLLERREQVLKGQG